MERSSAAKDEIRTSYSVDWSSPLFGLRLLKFDSALLRTFHDSLHSGESLLLIFILLYANNDALLYQCCCSEMFFSLQTIANTKNVITQTEYRWKCTNIWILKHFLCPHFAPGRGVSWKASSYTLNATWMRIEVPRDLTLTELLSYFFNEEEFLFQLWGKQKTAAANTLQGNG